MFASLLASCRCEAAQATQSHQSPEYQWRLGLCGVLNCCSVDYLLQFGFPFCLEKEDKSFFKPHKRRPQKMMQSFPQGYENS